MRARLPSPALAISLAALVLSTTGLANAAGRAVATALAGHPVTSHPRPGAILTLGRNGKFPTTAIPTVRNATHVDGKTPEQLLGTCPPRAVDMGSWCLSTSPYPVPHADAGKNNFIWASKACGEDGGWLPSASQLLSGAARVLLESTIHDSPATATVSIEPSLGLIDRREMSSTLITTEAGSAAAGSEGVSEGATGNPHLGQPNPVPAPANPVPQTLQYVTVYSNGTKGGFAGSEPVGQPENFRCAFNKGPAHAAEGEG
jgi:hypothetical protein